MRDRQNVRIEWGNGNRMCGLYCIAQPDLTVRFAGVPPPWVAYIQIQHGIGVDIHLLHSSFN